MQGSSRVGPWGGRGRQLRAQHSDSDILVLFQLVCVSCYKALIKHTCWVRSESGTGRERDGEEGGRQCESSGERAWYGRLWLWPLLVCGGDNSTHIQSLTYTHTHSPTATLNWRSLWWACTHGACTCARMCVCVFGGAGVLESVHPCNFPAKWHTLINGTRPLVAAFSIQLANSSRKD